MMMVAPPTKAIRIFAKLVSVWLISASTKKGSMPCHIPSPRAITCATMSESFFLARLIFPLSCFALRQQPGFRPGRIGPGLCFQDEMDIALRFGRQAGKPVYAAAIERSLQQAGASVVGCQRLFIIAAVLMDIARHETCGSTQCCNRVPRIDAQCCRRPRQKLCNAFRTGGRQRLWIEAALNVDLPHEEGGRNACRERILRCQRDIRRCRECGGCRHR